MPGPLLAVDRDSIAALAKGILVMVLIAQLVALFIILRSEERRAPDGGQLAPGRPAETRPTPKRPQTAEEEGSPNDSRLARQDGPKPTIDAASHVSFEGGYRLEYPRGWELEGAGRVTEITSPDQKVKVSCGLAPAGDLTLASARLTDEIQERYRDVIVTESSRVKINGRAAWNVEGKATNEDGVRLLFRSITIAGRHDIFAIIAFEVLTVDTPTIRAEVGEIAESFHELRDNSSEASRAQRRGQPPTAEGPTASRPAELPFPARTGARTTPT
jgi:hypothetical protein